MGIEMNLMNYSFMITMYVKLGMAVNATDLYTCSFHYFTIQVIQRMILAASRGLAQ